MKKFIPYLLILLLTFSFLGAYQSAQASGAVWHNLTPKTVKVDDSLQVILDNSAPGDMLTVIVTLDKQADLSRVNGADRAARLQGVIQALQATANETQGRLTGLLNTYRSQGLVDSFTPLWVFNGFSVTATVEVINTLAQDPDVYTITPNNIEIVPTYGTPEANVSLVNAPILWDQGYTGQGVVVASMDSGVDASHPDLSSRWRGGSNSWYDPYGQHSTPADLSGHGTWTTGVMVGGDAGGTSIGVAPGAQWIAVKIFNDQGGSTATAIHQGFQWLLDPDGNPNTADAPQVVNNSWTYAIPGCYLDFELDLESLRAVGILPVFAAGNGGPYSGTSYSPANNPAAFAVGAVDNNDQIYAYSSRGPSTCGGSTGPYPEMVAPGFNIHTTELYGIYTTESGTSMAAPHVAGGLALLLSAYPNLDAGLQADALINSAVDLGASGPDDVFGYGRLDLSSAFDWVTAGPPPTQTPTPTATPTPTSMPTPTPTISPDINLALNQPVTVSSSQDTAHDGSMAVDGNLSTYWQTAKASGRNKLPAEWIQIDLGAEMPVGRVVLEWGSNFAIDYSIQTSLDQNQWVTASSTSSGDGGIDEIIFATVSARYIRMNSTTWSSGTWRNSLEEFEIYSGGGTQPTPTPEPTPTPTPGPTQYIHIGNLVTSAYTEPHNRWAAHLAVLVHDEADQPVSGVTVSGVWSNGVSGGGSCITDVSGNCMIDKTNIKGIVSSVSFDINNLSHTDYQYDPSANHNANGESITSIVTILQP